MCHIFVLKETTELLKFNSMLGAVACQGCGLGGSNPPPPLEILKALENRAKLNSIWKVLKIAEFRVPTPQDVRKKAINSKTI